MVGTLKPVSSPILHGAMVEYGRRSVCDISNPTRGRVYVGYSSVSGVGKREAAGEAAHEFNPQWARH